MLQKKKLDGTRLDMQRQEALGCSSKADIVRAPDGPETKVKVTQVTFAALNLFYPRSIKAL
jgi:hypothetical protein